MIATNILLYFVSARWVSAVDRVWTTEEDKAIATFLEATDLESDWGPAYAEIDKLGLLDDYLSQKFQKIENIVNEHFIQDEAQTPEFQETLDTIRSHVYLMRYSNLKILQQVYQYWPDGGRGTPLGMITDEYISEGIGRYHRQKTTPMGMDLMPYMISLAVQSSMNESIPNQYTPDSEHVRLEFYQNMINRVYKDMGRLIKRATQDSWSTEIEVLHTELKNLDGRRTSGYAGHEIKLVVANLGNLLLTMNVMHGDSSEPSPKIVSHIIRNHQLVRRFLHVDNDMFKWTPDNFDELLKSLGEVVVKMLDECPDGPRWIQKLRSMVLRLRAMGMEKVVGVDCTTHNTQSLVPSSSTPSSSRASRSRASRSRASRSRASRSTFSSSQS